MFWPRQILRRRVIARTAVVGGAAYYAAKRTRRAGQPGANATPQEPTPEEPVSDPIEQIKQLNELRSQGILSDEEFIAEKRKLLGT